MISVATQEDIEKLWKRIHALEKHLEVSPSYEIGHSGVVIKYKPIEIKHD